MAFACVDHRLNSESHAGDEFVATIRAAVMQDLWIFMKILAYAVAAVFPYD